MTTYVAPLLQRTLAVVYQFHDAFFEPIDDRTPPIRVPLDVSIPSLQWTALAVADDATYRFSALTLTAPAPTGVNLEVQVASPTGEYVSFDPILVTLPRPLSSPVQRDDFLIRQPLWPTTAVRPPASETAVRGHITSPTAQPVANLAVEMWSGPPVPPAGTPVTRSNVNGDFLYRFPLRKDAAGSIVALRIRLDGGAVPVSPATLSTIAGRTQIIEFLRS